MSNAIAINLRRFRKVRHLTQKSLADAAGISRVAYRNIETGVAMPRSGTLEALAGALKVDVFELAAEIPQAKTLRFRANKTLTAHERAERDQLVIETMNWLVDFNELEGLLNEPIAAVVPKKGFAVGGIAADAEEIRRTAFKVECQGCLPDICDILEKGGIKVRTLRSGMSRLFGFCVGAADGGPAIIVNTSDGIPVERRIFTAAHELGHLMLHGDSFDPAKVVEDARQEKEADLFASHFLMPGELFDGEWSRNRGLHWVDRVMKTKRTFRVSWMTVLYRLCEKGDADRSKIFRQFQAAYKQRMGRDISFKAEPESIGVPAAATRSNQEPERLTDFDFCEDRFERLVRKALESDAISVSRAAEMLGKSVVDVRAMLLDWKEHQ